MDIERYPVGFLGLLYNNCAFLKILISKGRHLKHNLFNSTILFAVLLKQTKTQGRSILQTIKNYV